MMAAETYSSSASTSSSDIVYRPKAPPRSRRRESQIYGVHVFYCFFFLKNTLNICSIAQLMANYREQNTIFSYVLYVAIAFTIELVCRRKTCLTELFSYHLGNTLHK